MRNLNSVLLEGEVCEDPISAYGPESRPACSFLVSSGDSAPAVPVIIYDKLAARCSEILNKGSSIRLVGHIAQDLGAIAIVAEHVEIKPSVSHGEVANVF